MLTIPTSLQTVFDTQQALDVRFIITVNWGGTEEYLYSSEEFDTWTVYPYIEEISNFESVSQVDGLGEVSSIEIVFNDFYGHFKEMLDTYDVFAEATTCEVAITVSDGTEKLTLFSGKIIDPLVWQEEGKKLMMTIESESSDGIIGYTPSIDDIDSGETNYDYFEEYLTGKPWPELFGEVAYYPVSKVATRKNTKTSATALFKRSTVYGDGNNYETFKATDTDMYLPMDDLGTFTLDDASASAEVTLNMTGNLQGVFSIFITGRFKSIATNPVAGITDPYYFHCTDATGVDNKITTKWFNNVPFEFLDRETIGETNPTDEGVRTAITLLMGDDYPSPAPSTEPTYWDGSTKTDDARIELMTVKLTWDVISPPLTGVTQYANVTLQKDNFCNVDQVINAYYITDPANTENGNVEWAKKVNEGIYRIPAGVTLYNPASDDIYVFDLKKESVIQDIFIATGDEMVKLPESIYDVYNNTSTTTAASGVYKANTGTSTEFWDWDAAAEEPSEYSWVQINAMEFIRFLEGVDDSEIEDEIWVIAKNLKDKDAETVGYIGAKYSNLPSAGDVNYVALVDTDFVFLEEEEVLDVLPEICWQGKRAIRRTINAGAIEFDLIDISTPTAPVLAFTDANVKLDTIAFSFTPVEEVITQINSTAVGQRYNKEPWRTKRRNNLSLYGLTPYDADFYIHNMRSEISTSLDFWIDRLSNIRRTVSFTGYMDAIGLEVWDRASISFSDPSYYDVTKGIPFNNVHTATTVDWASEGWVREVRARPQEGEVDIVIELDSVVTESPNQTIRTVIS